MNGPAKPNDFIRFLNRNYYITSHVAERLDEIKEAVLFENIREPITAAIKSLELQIIRIETLFGVLQSGGSVGDCGTMIAFLESIFNTIQSNNNTLSGYTSLFDYVAVADALMKESAELARLLNFDPSELGYPLYSLYDPTLLQPLKDLLRVDELTN